MQKQKPKKHKGELRFFRFVDKENRIFSRGGIVAFVRKTRSRYARLGFACCSFTEEWNPNGKEEPIKKAICRSLSKKAAKMESVDSDPDYNPSVTSIVADHYNEIIKRRGYDKEIKRRGLHLQLHKIIEVSGKNGKKK